MLVITAAKPQPLDVASRPSAAELGLAALAAFANSGALGVKRGSGPPQKKPGRISAGSLQRNRRFNFSYRAGQAPAASAGQRFASKHVFKAT